LFTSTPVRVESGIFTRQPLQVPIFIVGGQIGSTSDGILDFGADLLEGVVIGAAELI
jgi:hypothetical protein